MKIKFLFLIVSIIILNSVFISSLPLSITSNTTTLNMTKDVTSSITISIFNPNNFSLYNLRAESNIIVSYSNISQLDSGATSSMNILIKTSEIGSLTKQLKIVGFTIINCSVLQQRTFDINISSSGASPRDLEVCKNDNIRYTNGYGNSVYLNIEQMSVNQGIAAGTSFVQNFPSLGIIAYRIEPLIDLGYVTVKDVQSSVHDSTTDGVLSLNIYSVFEETNITITSISNTNFTMNYDSLQSGFVIIKNTGTKTAKQISLFSDWMTFDKNNFDINSNADVAVNFVISPNSLTTDQTNRSYNKTIKIVGINTNEINQPVNVFINYGIVNNDNMSLPEWWIKKKEFCLAFPTSPYCLTEPYVVYRDKTVYDCPPILMNISPSDVKKYLDSQGELRNDFSNLGNNLKLDSNTVKETLISSNNVANSSFTAQMENKKEISNLRNILYVLLGTFIFLILLAGIGFLAWNYYQKRKLGMEKTI